ncbi:MAG: hypothetical protein KGL39_37915 [Patescibacteria group bacterium]|nr:hypothetical protein [Patescibacteria group bacterium]
MNKYYAIGGIVALVLAFAGISSIHKPTQTILYGGTSPEIASPYLTVGGLTLYTAHTDNLTQATSTLCSLPAPAATTTLQQAGIRITSGTTTAVTVGIYLGGKNSTSTLLYSGTVGTSSTATLMTATSTVIDPTQYVTITAYGSGAYNQAFSMTGSCGALFVGI